MSSLPRWSDLRRTHLALAGAGAVVAAGLLVGASLTFAAGTPTPAPSTPLVAAPSPAAVARDGGLGIRPRLRALVRRADRASFQVRTRNGWETIEFARGTIASVAAGKLVVDLPSGTSVTWVTDAQTVVRIKGQKSSLAGLAAGQEVQVFGTSAADGTLTARLIRVPRRAAAPAASTASPSPVPTT